MVVKFLGVIVVVIIQALLADGSDFGHHRVYRQLDGNFPIEFLSAYPNRIESLEFVRASRSKIYGMVLDDAEEKSAIVRFRGKSMDYLVWLANMVDTTNDERRRTKTLFEDALKGGNVESLTITGATMFGDEDTIKIIQELVKHKPHLAEDAESSIYFIRRAEKRAVPMFSEKRGESEQQVIMIAMAYPHTSDAEYMQKLINELTDSEIASCIELGERNEFNIGFLFLNVLAEYVKENGSTPAIESHALKMAKTGDLRARDQARRLLKLGGIQNREDSLTRGGDQITRRSDKEVNESNEKASSGEASSHYWVIYVVGGVLVVSMIGWMYVKRVTVRER